MIPALVFMGIPLALYLCQGWLVYYPRGRIGMSIAMTGYAIGNVGLLIDMWEQSAGRLEGHEA